MSPDYLIRLFIKKKVIIDSRGINQIMGNLDGFIMITIIIMRFSHIEKCLIDIGLAFTFQREFKFFFSISQSISMVI